MIKRKTISIFMTLCMLISATILPIKNAYALDNMLVLDYNNIAEESNAENAFEQTASRYIDYTTELATAHTVRAFDEEALNTIVYNNSDGSQTVYFFDEDIKYTDDNGNIVEKNITLEAVNGGYKTKSNNISTILPTRLADGITVTYNDSAVRLAPITNNSGVSTFALGEAEHIAIPNMVANKIGYASVFGSNTTLEYTPTLRGVKEEIVLSRYTGVNSWSFLARTNGLYAYLGDDGIYYFAENEDADVKFSLGQVFAYDSAANIDGGTMTVATVSAGQIYRVTITVNDSFLANSSTVYPVYVDPQITVISDTESSNIIDTTVYSGKPDLNTGTWALNHVGYYSSDYGIGRMLVKLPGLSSYYNRNNITINDAKFYLYEASGLEGQSISIFAFGGSSWTETGATWNNCNPNTTMGTFATATTSANAYVEFDIKGLFTVWNNNVRDSDLGFILKNADEADATKCRAFIANTNSATEKRPKVSLTYTIPVSSIGISPSIVNVDVNATVQLSATVNPSDATNKNVTWSSDNTNVATVSSNGLVTGINPGTANITCVSADGNKTPERDCYVTVNPIASSYTVMTKDTVYHKNVISGTSAWFKFTPSVSGTYSFKTTGDLNTTGRLYLGTTQLCMETDFFDDLNFNLAYRLEAGLEYRLCVEAYATDTSDLTSGYGISVKEGWPKVSTPTIKSRSDWGARSVVTSQLVARMRAPQRIMFHDSVSQFDKTDEASVIAEIKNIQKTHMDTGNNGDIAYHFIIDPAGRIWQGAEVDEYQRVYVAGYNDDISVLIMGNFSNNVLNDDQKNAIETLSKWLCYKYELLRISSGATMVPIITHRTVEANTSCPGASADAWIEGTLRAIINSWRE